MKSGGQSCDVNRFGVDSNEPISRTVYVGRIASSSVSNLYALLKDYVFIHLKSCLIAGLANNSPGEYSGQHYAFARVAGKLFAQHAWWRVSPDGFAR